MEILRYAAFSSDPAGGNPAGVVLDAAGVDDSVMLATAAEVGFSETAFVVPRADGTLDVRYFSPLVEIPFCGHATIALAVAHAQRYGAGDLRLRTKAGLVSVSTGESARLAPIPDGELADMLGALHWPAGDLDPALPPRAAYAGAWHPVIAARTRRRLADLDYDMAALGAVMKRNAWATVDLVWRVSPAVYYARNPFPPGGVVEDPATGAAAAAFGGYLRELDLVCTPATITVFQGQDMGRPGKITVTVPADRHSGIAVNGAAVEL
jgi:PhzF family phenazine biosynthesis protein